MKGEARQLLYISPFIAMARLAYSYSRDTGWLLLILVLAAYSLKLLTDIAVEALHAPPTPARCSRHVSEIEYLTGLLGNVARNEEVLRNRISRLTALRIAALTGISPSEAASKLEDILRDKYLIGIIRGENRLATPRDVEEALRRVENLKVGVNLKEPS